MCIGDVSQLMTLLRYNGAAAGGGGVAVSMMSHGVARTGLGGGSKASVTAVTRLQQQLTNTPESTMNTDNPTEKKTIRKLKNQQQQVGPSFWASTVASHSGK